MLLFSVIIPCYNHGAYIEDAIDSVLKYPHLDDLEIIVVNDGSTDLLTINILSKLSKLRTRVISQGNKGLGAARNRGISEAIGQNILLLDSDNTIDFNYLIEAKKIFSANNNIGIVYSDKYIFGKGLRTKHVKVADFNPKMMLLVGNFIDACAVIRKLVFDNYGGYAENMPYMGFEDWEFWVKCIGHEVEFYHIKKPLFNYRDSPESMLKNTLKKKVELTDYIIQKHHLTYAKYIQEITKEYSYMKRKPIRYTLKNMFKNIL